MPPKKKKVTGLIKLQIQAGQANPGCGEDKGVDIILRIGATGQEGTVVHSLQGCSALGSGFLDVGG